MVLNVWERVARSTLRRREVRIQVSSGYSGRLGERDADDWELLLAPESDAVLFDALHDETSCAILALITDRARSVGELAELLDKSPSTIYRRMETLQSYDLVTEGLELDRNGHHRHLYRSSVRRLVVEFADETVTIRVQHRGDAVDRFTRLWKTMQGRQ